MAQGLVRTTGFWRAGHGFKSQQETFFLFHKSILKFLGLYFFCSYQNQIFPSTLSRFFMKQEADFCRHFVFFYCYNSFQDHNEFSTFFLNCFPRCNILNHAMAVYAKHRQILANTRMSLLRNILVPWDNRKIVITAFLKFFPYQNL